MPRARKGDHQFGGEWTAQKLDVLAKYLVAYSTALRDKPTPENPFQKAFIDGFAGTGSRVDSSTELDDESGQESLFSGEPAGESVESLRDGSARIALRTNPPFDKYIFIEQSQQRCNQLEDLKGEYPDLAERVSILQGNANDEIKRLCKRNWSAHRAVMFLDPYGMQVEWATIEAIAATRAIDLWLLYPLGIGVNRLLTRTGVIPPGWQRRLTLLLGNEEWREEGYSVEKVTNLFGEDDEQLTKTTMEVLGSRFNQRLATIFPGVAEPAGILRNSRGTLLYLLCFAAANERGAPTALKIANSLLRRLR
ncbi:MAG: three-Cys-motif partner protein TcmP [Gemmatimonadales bacterium]